jgi:hypothetical protein
VLIESEHAPKHSKEEIEEGTAIMMEVLQNWVSKSSAAGAADDDVVMGDTEPSDADLAAKLEAELELLRACFTEASAKIEGNGWCRTAIETL